MKDSEMSLIGLFARIGMAIASGCCWWKYNVVLGNSVALEQMGFFTNVGESWRLLIASAGSFSQLYWSEDIEAWGNNFKSGWVTSFCVSVLCFDIFGPAYGFLISQKMGFGVGEILLSIVWSFFFSVICQEVAWRTSRDVFLFIASQINLVKNPKRVGRAG